MLRLCDDSTSDAVDLTTSPTSSPSPSSSDPPPSSDLTTSDAFSPTSSNNVRSNAEAQQSTSASVTPSVVTTQTSLTTITLPNGETSTSTAYAVTTANGQLSGNGGGSGSNGFFSNTGAVGGTFAVVGLVVAALVAGVFYMLWKRKKAQKMDADVVAAASAAAATTRTPFDDDDPEMIEHPSYGMGAAAGAGTYGASSAQMQQYYNNYGNTEGYEASHMSGGTNPGYAGMGAYGPMAGGAAAAGAAGYYAGHQANDGTHYYESVPGALSSEGYGQSVGHDNGYSQSAHHDDLYASPSGGHSGYGGGQQGWHNSSPPLDTDAAYSGTAAGAYGAHSPDANNGDVFADPSRSSSNDPDARIDMRAHDGGSSTSLRDDQDYGRRLAVRNSDN